MSEDDRGGKQMSTFLIKKGDYLCGLAATHSQGMEHDKAKNFYLQAASWYKKGNATEKMNEALKKAKEEDQKLKQSPQNP